MALKSSFAETQFPVNAYVSRLRYTVFSLHGWKSWNRLRRLNSTKAFMTSHFNTRYKSCDFWSATDWNNCQSMKFPAIGILKEEYLNRTRDLRTCSAVPHLVYKLTENHKQPVYWLSIEAGTFRIRRSHNHITPSFGWITPPFMYV